MAFNMNSGGAGWRLAGSLIQLGHEVAAAYPEATCLGTIGNSQHEAEGALSDHNPIVKDPHTGIGIVRAIDIGGPNAMLQQIRQRIWILYAEQDPRLWEYGYSKGTSDNLVNNFGLPFKTHVDDGDAGHLHISVTQSHYPSIPSGYLPAIDSTAGWGFADVPAGGGTPIGDDMDSDQDAKLTALYNAVVNGTQFGAGTYFAGLVQHVDAIDTAVAALKAQQVPTIDYTQLAAALIAQLKAA